MNALYYGRVATAKQLKESNTMNKTTYTTTRFDVSDDFYVEVLNENESICFYLCHNCIGIKSFMFGMKKELAPPEKWEHLICDNVDICIEYYTKEYCD